MHHQAGGGGRPQLDGPRRRHRSQIAEVAAFDQWACSWESATGSVPGPRHGTSGPTRADPSRAGLRARRRGLSRVREFVRFAQGTKGGRPRDETATNRRAARTAHAAADHRGQGAGMSASRVVRRPEPNLLQRLRRFGITRNALGVTAHGLRHQSANDGYEADTSAPSRCAASRNARTRRRATRTAIPPGAIRACVPARSTSGRWASQPG